MRTLLLLIVLLAVPATLYAQTTPTYDDPSFVGPPHQPKKEDPLHPHEHLPDVPPKTTQTVEQKLQFALSGYEHFPTKEELEGIAPQETLIPLLLSFVKDLDNPMVKLRAVEALGYYNTPQVLDFLNKLAHGPTNPSPQGANLQFHPRLAISLQHRAILSLGKAARHDSIRYLEDLLANHDVQLQLTVVSALGKHAGHPGRLLIQRFVANHPDPLVLSEAEKFLQ